MIRASSGSARGAGDGFDLGATCVQVTLEHDLGGQLVTKGLALLTGQAGVEQTVLGLDGGIAFVEVEDGPLRDAAASH